MLSQAKDKAEEIDAKALQDVLHCPAHISTQCFSVNILLRKTIYIHICFIIIIFCSEGGGGAALPDPL